MIAIRIKTLRKEQGLSQAELAKKLGVARSSVTAYEINDVYPPIDKLQAMSKIFGVSINYLTGESNSRTEVVEDVDDIEALMTDLMDRLQLEDVAIKFHGKTMTPEMKSIAFDQMQNTLKILTYLNR